jgi:hypothetical protein
MTTAFSQLGVTHFMGLGILQFWFIGAERRTDLSCAKSDMIRLAIEL